MLPPPERVPYETSFCKQIFNTYAKIAYKKQVLYSKKSLSKNILLKSNLLAHLVPIQNFWKVAREKHFSQKRLSPQK